MFVQRAQAWNDSLARVAVQLAPVPRRFACARALADRARGTLRITVKPNAVPTRTGRHTTYRVTLRLWVSHTRAAVCTQHRLLRRGPTQIPEFRSS